METADAVAKIQEKPKVSSLFGPGPAKILQAPNRDRATRESPIDPTRIDAARKAGVHLHVIDGDLSQALAAVEALRKKIGVEAALVAVRGSQTSLSEVHKLTRAGATEVIPDTVSQTELDEMIARLSRNVAPATEPHADGKVIAVSRARGGVGATTLAVNLAEALLDRHGYLKKVPRNSVVLVDLDLQLGDVASFLDLGTSDTLYDLAMSGQEPDQTLIRQSLKMHPSGLAVLTAPTRFAPLDALKSRQVGTLIEILRQTHDFVVLDLPCGLVDWLDQVMAQSDRMLMVTDCAVPSIRQARRLIDFYAETNLSLKIDVIINHEARPMILRSHHKAAETVLERKFNHWIPDDPAAARAAIDRGVPLAEASPRARMTKAIANLGKDLAAALTTVNAHLAPKPD